MIVFSGKWMLILCEKDAVILASKEGDVLGSFIPGPCGGKEGVSLEGIEGDFEPEPEIIQLACEMFEKVGL